MLATIETPAELAPAGVWTPWATVLCWTCHGSQMLAGRTVPVEEYARRCEPREIEDGEGPAHCGKCNGPIWTRDDVALLDRLVRLIEDDEPIRATLEQTGGMCAAASFSLLSTETDDEDSTDPLIVASDGEDLDNPDHVLLGLYEAADWWHWSRDLESCQMLGTFSIEDAAAIIRGRVVAS